MTIYFKYVILVLEGDVNLETKSIYRSIFEELKSRIIKGTYRSGDKIPTEAEWAKKFNVSRITVQKAMEIAVENHLISKYPGKGTFVTDNAQQYILKSGRLNKMVIGIIRPDCSDFFGLEIFMSIEKIAQKDGVMTLVGLSDEYIETEKKLIKEFIEFGVDGFIIWPVHNEKFNNDILKLIFDKVPVVLIDRFLKEISCPNVVSDNYEAAAKGMEYLYSLGHRNIGIVTQNIGLTSSLQEREQGILKAATENGHKIKNEWWFTDIPMIDYNYNKRIDLLESNERLKNLVIEYLKKNKEITAIFCLEFAMYKIVEAAAKAIGLNIPNDLSIMSFDYPLNLSNSFDPVITHLKQNERAIADTSYSLLMKIIRGEPYTYQHKIDVSLVEGCSTRSLTKQEQTTANKM